MADEANVAPEHTRPAAAQWEPAGVTYDALKRQIRVQLSDGRLGSVNGVSKSQRGTGRPCVVCRRAIGPTEVEREVEGQGVFLHAHEACYKPWREESVARRAAAAPVPRRGARKDDF